MTENAISLDKKSADLCIGLGISGAVLSVFVFVQHIIIMLGVWIAILMMIGYLISVFSFIQLALRKKIAPFLIMASAIFLFAILVYHIISFTFVLLPFILLIYTIIVSIFLFVSDIPKKLKSNHQYLKSENEFWSNKL